MAQQELYDPRFEHDSCGIGAVVDLRGRKTHKPIEDALSIIERLEHRAGHDASGETGDGAGMLLQIPHALFSAVVPELRAADLGEREYGVGMFFMPNEPLARARAKKLFETIARRDGLEPLCWREVPARPEVLGERARESMPCIRQCFIKKPADCAVGVDFDRRLYFARREFEQSATGAYVCSLSSRTVVYKGMFLVKQLRRFYPDLDDKRCESALALVHSRFSTNTNPSWERAHPNRLLLHNGEINTVRGNIDRMLARAETVSSPLIDGELERILPVIAPNGSDSAALDNALEFLMFGGMDLAKAAMVCIPEPWKSNADMPRERRDMFHYYATMMESWDGPAALLFSDGDTVGAALDRNGLRPARWCETRDGFLALSSEVGALDIAPSNVLRRSRLAPGGMLVADTVRGRLYEDGELKDACAASNPYGEWLDSALVTLSSIPIPAERPPMSAPERRAALCKAFGYSYEDIMGVILPMAENGAEPTASMGDDTPLAVLSKSHRPLFDCFKEQFAQVTNPPIDAIREEIVTDTTVYVGSDGNLLADSADNCRVLQINNPILTETDLMKLRALDMDGLKSGVVSLLYYKDSPLEDALERLFVDCDNAYRRGCNILILSDRGVDENHTAIPSLLAVSALEQYLIRTKKRTAVSVILESAEPKQVHDFAALLGYGARAVNPYLAHECIGGLIDGSLLERDFHAAVDVYNDAALRGVVRVASKMGISSIQSYQSAQCFETLGIDKEVIDKYFTNTINRVGGIGLKEMGETVLRRHERAFDPLSLNTDLSPDSDGLHKLRSGEGAESHRYSPLAILTLQKAVRNGDYEEFKRYSALINDESSPRTLRGLLEFAPAAARAPLDEVEPAESIMRRFKTGAMSYGSISEEAHECLALAMNAVGGKSNSGEGGEARERLGAIKNSAIKQVASGRFGVTSEYLVSAKEIQIKMAQGAKPGEGGYLPAAKVWPWIAKTRLSTPGVPLISPPPHHDVYSIEDLAQLIFDLKCANRLADVSVKLVSEAGVGTIACGVAKAGARTILISGGEGGTGAAPLGSIHSAGLPWELGVAEAHGALVRNGLRASVRLEADGKLMTGRDAAIACILGAEEFGFATAPLVALGCMMMRACNLDTCPFGIATQDPRLRENFAGRPEYVVNFMRFVAEELREIMASLGVRSVDALVGHTELLRARSDIKPVDVSALLDAEGEPAHFEPSAVMPFEPNCALNEDMLDALLAGDAPEFRVTCEDRAFGALLGAEITRRFGTSLTEGAARVKCVGGAGQSFGAFIPKGLSLELEGEANDYLGKGLSGGQIVVYPYKESACEAGENVVIGNVALYGATSGEAYIRGAAGERFAVRNSGATAVVEGVGDHGCEYMTGGRVAVLGRTGRNFAAGMSGGVAYVLDERHDLYRRVNKTLVAIEPLTQESDCDELKEMLERHAALTGSERAAEILADFDARAKDFKKITPRAWRNALKSIAEGEARGLTRERAELEAFMKERCC